MIYAEVEILYIFYSLSLIAESIRIDDRYSDILHMEYDNRLEVVTQCIENGWISPYQA